MKDLSHYIGLPYESRGRGPRAFDCWGLVRLFYQREVGVDLRDLSDGYADAGKDVDGVVATVMRESAQWARVEPPAFADVVLFRIAGKVRHAGVVVAPGLMLHSLDGHESVLERFDGPKWGRRVEGFYRHAAA